MTKNSASKRRIREHAALHGLKYMEARLRLGLNTETASGVWVRCQFIGEGAPAPVSFDAAEAMATFQWRDVEMCVQDGWSVNPSGPQESDLPNLLHQTAVATQRPDLLEASAWLRTNSREVSERFEAPSLDAPLETKWFSDQIWDYPVVFVFDVEAGERWVRDNCPRHAQQLMDLVTPPERWEWMEWHERVHINCDAGRHFWDGSPSPHFGECFGCGARMVEGYDENGDEVTRIVDEDEFFAELDEDAVCNWAPPSSSLKGQTQWSWLMANIPAYDDSTSQVPPTATNPWTLA